MFLYNPEIHPTPYTRDGKSNPTLHNPHFSNALPQEKSVYGGNFGPPPQDPAKPYKSAGDYLDTKLIIAYDGPRLIRVKERASSMRAGERSEPFYIKLVLNHSTALLKSSVT